MLIAKWILQSRKRCGASEVYPPKLPVREQGPETGLPFYPKYLSKTSMDKNSVRAPSDAHPTSQQKRHSVRSALKNGGAAIFDGFRVLRPAVLGRNSLFIRQLTGKKQARAGLSFGFRSHIDICGSV